MSKLIHAASLAGFKTAFPYWANTDTDATNPNSSYKSVVYTDDGCLYTHGKIFQLAVRSDGNTASWLTASLSGQTLTLNSAGISNAITVTLPVVGITSGTSTELTVSGDHGVYSISHKNDYLASTTTKGPVAASNTTINVPYLTATTSGHVDVLEQYTATLNHVAQTLDTTTTTTYLLFGTSATTATAGSVFNTSLKANMSDGSLFATNFYEGGYLLSTKYAPSTHASSSTSYGVGSDSLYGHLKLSDSTSDTTSGVSAGIAATPKAVSAALTSAKSYADSILGANDAMVFKGTIGTGGTVTALPTTGYSAGWTYRVVTAATYAGVACEIGDLIICVKDYATAFNNSDWTVAQTNIEGAVTTSGTLTADTLILGAGTKTISSLNNGSNGQFLSLSGNKPTWTTIGALSLTANTGATTLATYTNSATSLDFKGSTNISLTASGGSLTISATGLVTTASVKNFTVSGLNAASAATSIVYNATTANAISFDSSFITTSGGAISHRNSTTAKTQALYRIAIDAQGHITTSGDPVTSLPNANALKLQIASGTTEGTSQYTYDGSAPKTLNIVAGSPNITLTPTAGVLTISSTDTNTVSDLAIGAAGTTTSAVTTNGNTYLKIVNNGVLKSSFKIAGNGATTVGTNASGDITIESSNTWRNVTAYSLSTNVSGSILNNSVGTADLDFGNEFLWDTSGGSGDGQLRIGWAEITADGTITYTV